MMPHKIWDPPFDHHYVLLPLSHVLYTSLMWSRGGMLNSAVTVKWLLFSLCLMCITSCTRLQLTHIHTHAAAGHHISNIMA